MTLLGLRVDLVDYDDAAPYVIREHVPAAQVKLQAPFGYLSDQLQDGGAIAYQIVRPIDPAYQCHHALSCTSRRLPRPAPP